MLDRNMSDPPRLVVADHRSEEIVDRWYSFRRTFVVSLVRSVDPVGAVAFPGSITNSTWRAGRGAEEQAISGMKEGLE